MIGSLGSQESESWVFGEGVFREIRYLEVRKMGSLMSHRGSDRWHHWKVRKQRSKVTGERFWEIRSLQVRRVDRGGIIESIKGFLRERNIEVRNGITGDHAGGGAIRQWGHRDQRVRSDQGSEIGVTEGAREMESNEISVQGKLEVTRSYKGS